MQSENPITPPRPDACVAVPGQAEMAAAFNEWMRRYTEEPETFAHEWETVGEFLGDQAAGREPSYGAWCAAFLTKLMAEGAATVAPNPADQGK